VHTRRFNPEIVEGPSRELSQRLGIPDDAKVIACVTGFRAEKAHALLLEAFAKLRKREPRAVLVLAGDGPLRGAIERQIDRLRLHDAVCMAGIMGDVRPLLSLARFTVLSSIAVETFSMAMLESMAMGTPVVATEIGGANEAITAGRDGLLVPPGDTEALLEAMGRLLSDEIDCRRMGEIARQKVVDSFSKERMVARTAMILQTASRGAR